MKGSWKSLLVIRLINLSEMKHKRLQSFALLLLVLGLAKAEGQQAIPASGGNALGSGGSASFSVGLVAYTTPKAETGSLAQGVQNAWEIYTVGIFGTDPGFSVHPNPVTNGFTLQIPVFQDEKFGYQLFDAMGRLLESERLTRLQTYISTAALPPGLYVLNVMRENRKIQSFKIIKH